MSAAYQIQAQAEKAIGIWIGDSIGSIIARSAKHKH